MDEFINHVIINKARICPRCGERHFMPYGVELTPAERAAMIQRILPSFPAVSRHDNSTYICTPCGDDEAVRDFGGGAPMDFADWAFPPDS